jgi:parallel beta-helix repeat protein
MHTTSNHIKIPPKPHKFTPWLAPALILPLIFCSTGCNQNTSSVSENVYENTSRSGAIYSSERWRGTITITGDITIYSGTVTIEPGTTVQFTAGADDQNGGDPTPITDPYFPSDPAIAHSQISSINLYGGNFYAVGTSSQEITFTSTATNPAAGDWDALQYNQTGSRLCLQNVVIEYGYFGVQINAAANDSLVTFNHNTIRQIVTAGLLCGNPNSTPTVEITVSGNNFSYCNHEGIATFRNALVTIESNVFHDIWNLTDGGGAGVVIECNNSTVCNNQFLRNCVGIIVVSAESSPTISDNTFTDNQTDISLP